MSLSVVPTAAPTAERKPRRSEARIARRRVRLTEAMARAKTPSQLTAAALDYLRAALADNDTDPQTAQATAHDVAALLIEHADRLTQRRTR